RSMSPILKAPIKEVNHGVYRGRQLRRRLVSVAPQAIICLVPLGVSTRSSRRLRILPIKPQPATHAAARFTRREVIEIGYSTMLGTGLAALAVGRARAGEHG